MVRLVRLSYSSTMQCLPTFPETEAHGVKSRDEWKPPLCELKAFIFLLHVRGALCGKNRPILEIWDKNWGVPFLQKQWVAIAFAKS